MRRQNRRKLAEQNAKIDTLISLLGSHSVPNNATSQVAVPNKNDHVSKAKSKNFNSAPHFQSNQVTESTSTNQITKTGSGSSFISEKQQPSSTPVKNVLPLVTVTGPSDIELSPYSMGKYLNISLIPVYMLALNHSRNLSNEHAVNPNFVAHSKTEPADEFRLSL